MIEAAALGLIAVVLFGPTGVLLDRATWTSRSPRAGIALWQAIGLAGSLAAIGCGLAIAVAPLHAGVIAGTTSLLKSAVAGHPLAGLGLSEALGLTVAVDVAIVLVGGLGATVVRTYRARARHRQVLDLLSGTSEQAPDVALLHHPKAAAYYLPGRRGRIVVSSGTMALLGTEELSAVLHHERGHAPARHDLAMLPFASMTDLLRWMPYVRRAPLAVGRLIEMAADDFAVRRTGPAVLASALVRLASSGHAPACAIPFAANSVPTRVHRLIADDRLSLRAALAACALSGAALAAPIAAAFVS